MKMFNKYIVLALSTFALLFTSCEKEDLMTYSGNDVVNLDYRKMSLKKDSVDVVYGFIKDEFKQINLELLLTGYAQPVDREVKIKITSEEGAEAGVHYTIPEKTIIPAGEVMATIPFKILRPEILAEQATSILITLEDSESLKAGIYNTLYFRISDEIPDEWVGDQNWYKGSIEDFFGECSKTKYMFVYEQLEVWDFESYSVWGMMANKPKFKAAKRFLNQKLAEYEAANGPLIDPEKGRVTFPD